MNRVHVFLVVVVLYGPASFAAGIDVPTWQIGDAWDYEDALTLVSERADMQLNFAVKETYTSTVAEILSEPTAQGGVEKIYRLPRSNGHLSGSGTVQFPTYGSPLNIRLAATGSSDTGESTRLVSDLSQRAFEAHMKGDIEVQFLSVWTKVATIQLDMLTNYLVPGEEMDFPLETVGETWALHTTLDSTITLDVKFDPAFPYWALLGGKPNDIHNNTHDVRPLDVTYTYAGPAAITGWPDAVRFGLTGFETDWYSPMAEDCVRRELPGVMDPVEHVGFKDAVRRILAARLQPDPNIRSFAIGTVPAYQGQIFQVKGKATVGAQVTGTLLGEGGAAAGQIVTATVRTNGYFYLYLTAPNHDDRTPASADQGSFGVEVNVAGMGRKMITVQTLKRSAARSHWQAY